MTERRLTERGLTPARQAERSISKKYRREIWNPFIAAVKRYSLIAEGDRVAVCVTGDARSLLLGTLMRMPVRYSDFPFEAVFLAPEISGEDGEAFEKAVRSAELPVRTVPSDGERGLLASLIDAAEAGGCSAVAVSDCADEAVDTAVASMLFEGRLRGLMPKEDKKAGEIGLIRPLYCVEGSAVRAWVRYNGIVPAADVPLSGDLPEKELREEARRLLLRLKEEDPDIEKCVFHSLHAVHRDTFPGWIDNGERHSFTERMKGPE